MLRRSVSAAFCCLGRIHPITVNEGNKATSERRITAHLYSLTHTHTQLTLSFRFRPDLRSSLPTLLEYIFMHFSQTCLFKLSKYEHKNLQAVKRYSDPAARRSRQEAFACFIHRWWRHEGRQKVERKAWRQSKRRKKHEKTRFLIKQEEWERLIYFSETWILSIKLLYCSYIICMMGH